MLAAPAIVHAGNLMPISAKKIVLPQYDLIVVRGRNQFGHITEKRLFDCSPERLSEVISHYDSAEVHKLNSITRPWESADYGLRSDLEAAFASIH